MNPNNVSFVKSAVSRKDFPPDDLPDIAVAGRSNVGKSSLINSLFNRKRLAKVSGTPGKTRLINFFSVDETFYLVDLPGYGYAKRSRSERASWKTMVESYLATRDRLVAMLVLIDIRRGPEDEELMLIETLTNAGINVICVLTKSDKLSKSRRKPRMTEIVKTLGNNVGSIRLYSSKTNQGRRELWGEILGCLKAA